jgi:hypothetical protein
VITERHLGLLNGRSDKPSAPLTSQQATAYITASVLIQHAVSMLEIAGKLEHYAINEVRTADLTAVAEALVLKIDQRLNVEEA